MPYVEFIVLFQKRSVNDVADFPAMFIPVCVCERDRNAFQLCGQGMSMSAVTIFKRIVDSIRILVFHFPQIEAKGILPFTGIADIEDIANLRIISTVIDQRDPLGTAPDVPPHSVIPQIILRTGRCIRTLSEDHELFMIWILVQPCSRSQERCPLLIAPRDLSRSAVSQLNQGLCVCRQLMSSFLLSLPQGEFSDALTP